MYRPYIHSDHDRRNFEYLVIKVKENRKFTEILGDKVIRKMVKKANTLKKNDGYTDITFRKKMAFKVFKKTSEYDKLISNLLNGKKYY